MHRPTVVTALAFGSNIGEKQVNIERAVSLLNASGDLSLLQSSRFFRTPPWGYRDQDWFVNACALFETTLDPETLLDTCKRIEDDLGRAKSVRWGPRLIDIDILTWDAKSHVSERLTIPHPRLHERAFVLVPLHDIAPDLDIGGKTVREALSLIEARETESIFPLDL